MKRHLEPVDLVVAVGLFATVACVYLFFASTTGALDAGVPPAATIGRAPDIMDSMDWVQPALGQAIVDDYLLSRREASTRAATQEQLSRAMLVTLGLESSPNGQFESIRAWAARVEADQAARAQYVMGRFIVNFTQRGVRTGILGSDTYLLNDYNSRLIKLAETYGARISDEFQAGLQESIGWAVVRASHDHSAYMEQSQERLGRAIVRATHADSMFREALEAEQGQIGALVFAQASTLNQADLFRQLAQADFSAQRGPAPQSAERTWPDMPAGVLFGASAILIGLFFTGLLMPTARPEEEAAAESKEARPEKPERYRRTA